MRVQLLHFPGCPNVEAARGALREALATEQLDISIEEIDVQDPGAPSWARGWGSPTILVDGKDVAGQRPSESVACRLYPSGAPSVETIRRQLAAATATAPVPQANGRVALPMIGALAAAIAASVCCVVPAVLAAIGVSGVGFASWLSPYRVYFLIGTGIALATGFWFAYRPQHDACGCAAPRNRRAARVGLWVTTLLAAAIAAYPLFGEGNVTAGASEVQAKATLKLDVIGMDCKECTTTIARALKAVPGVVSASVDFDAGSAVVRHDGRDGMPSAAIKAVEDVGYRAEVQP